MLTVRDDLAVSVDYTLRLTDGEVVDSSVGRGPLTFIQGRGQIVPGLENALYGMSAGEEKDVVVAPCDAYGEFDAELFETLPRSVFPADTVLEEGQGFRLRTNSGQVAVAYIDSIENDQVTLDLNHPLAGETLYFNVKIADLREATAEDLADSPQAGGCSECAGGCADDQEGCGQGCGEEGGCCR